MNESWRKIGKVIGVTGIVVAASIAPGALVAIAPFFVRKAGLDEKETYRRLRYARRKKWFTVTVRDDGVFVRLTERGKKVWQRAELDQPLSRGRWDGKWRVAIFDVPDKKKLNRESLRRTLRTLGFVQLQESVWVAPWGCDDQIAAMKQLYELGDSLRLIIADTIDGQEMLIEKFELTAR